MLVEFSKYVVAGLCAAAGQYGTLIGLTEGFDFDPVHASAIGYVVAAIISYILNYRFTFRSTRRHVEALPIYSFIVTIGFLLNGGAMIVFTQMLNIHYLPSQLLTTCIVVTWQFLGHRQWTFRSKSTQNSSSDS